MNNIGQSGSNCQKISQSFFLFLQIADNKRFSKTLEKKHRFSMEKAPLFDSRSTASLPEKHRFFAEDSRNVKIIRNPRTTFGETPSET